MGPALEKTCALLVCPAPQTPKIWPQMPRDVEVPWEPQQEAENVGDGKPTSFLSWPSFGGNRVCVPEVTVCFGTLVRFGSNIVSLHAFNSHRKVSLR